MSYTKMNISDAEDRAPQYGVGQVGSARFFRDALGAQQIGMAHYKLNPSQRLPFGHNHEQCEELYLVVSGSGRMKVGEDVIDVGPQDLIFVEPATMRGWESGPDGMELIAFGAHAENDGNMEQGWWTD